MKAIKWFISILIFLIFVTPPILLFINGGEHVKFYIGITFLISCGTSIISGFYFAYKFSDWFDSKLK